MCRNCWWVCLFLFIFYYCAHSVQKRWKIVLLCVRHSPAGFLARPHTWYGRARIFFRIAPISLESGAEAVGEFSWALIVFCFFQLPHGRDWEDRLGQLPLAETGFNGASVFQRRKVHASLHHGAARHSFNGASVFQRRKGRTWGWYCQATNSFNGASFFQRRKVGGEG